MTRLRFESAVLTLGFAFAGVYAAVAIGVGLVGSRTDIAVVCAVMALLIAGPLVVVARLFEPPRQDGPNGNDSGGSSGRGPSGDDGGEPPDPWGDFERAFWQHVETQARRAPSAARGPGSRTSV